MLIHNEYINYTIVQFFSSLEYRALYMKFSSSRDTGNPVDNFYSRFPKKIFWEFSTSTSVSIFFKILLIFTKKTKQNFERITTVILRGKTWIVTILNYAFQSTECYTEFKCFSLQHSNKVILHTIHITFCLLNGKLKSCCTCEMKIESNLEYIYFRKNPKIVIFFLNFIDSHLFFFFFFAF